MKTSTHMQRKRLTLIFGLLLLISFFAWLLNAQKSPAPLHDGSAPTGGDGEWHESLKNSKGKAANTSGNFPVNDSMELPFLGVVRCHARQEQVKFTANGKQREWPFKVYYLPNGMFVRAEFMKPSAEDYEFPPKRKAESYRSAAESLVGFPDKPAAASLSKVLQVLYEHEAFDSATKINITWVLRQNSNNEIYPWFIANIYGVSPGLMRGPIDDPVDLRYRILLNADGEPVFTDNLL